jgi:hypothetical protein
MNGCLSLTQLDLLVYVRSQWTLVRLCVGQAFCMNPFGEHVVRHCPSAASRHLASQTKGISYALKGLMSDMLRRASGQLVCKYVCVLA